jgi:hypothetical protein
MTAPDLDAIEERANAATPGPWHVDDEDYAEAIYAADDVTTVIAGGRWGGEARVFETTEDARFIAHARTDVPALVAEVRRLRTELEWELSR